MRKFTHAIAFFTVIFLIISCSTFDKLREKLSSKKDNETTEKTVKEDIKEVTSGDDIEFYNKYIEVSNKIQEAGDKVYKDYTGSIPEPKTITKGSFIVAVAFSFSVGSLERTLKEYKRSFYDGGELSKLNASSDMKNEIEGELKNLLKTLDEYYSTSSKVSDYYSKGEFKKDISNAVPYDEEIKKVYDNYKASFNKFSDAIKKYKPKREKRDPESISNPDEKSVAVLLNSYENILDAAEVFYNSFNRVEFKGDLLPPKKAFDEFSEVYKTEKNNVLNAGFTDKTKYMKYTFEDYFCKMTDGFIESGNKFFGKAPDVKNEREFNTLYDDLVNHYNYMITAYNSNINTVNSFKVY